ncbi:MAG: hypothetical protein LBU85_00800 [Treponema sp.]|jgi:hypothetical protein|nr:hypothetical protein [Treponema sp.]
MKKIILLAVAVLLAASAAWGMGSAGKPAQPDSKVTHMANFNGADSEADKAEIRKAFDGKRAYFLDGFDFGNYNPSYDPDLKAMVAAEIGAIRNSNHAVNKGVQAKTGPYSIIGHSQGGLRALAHIKQLADIYPKNPEYLNEIDAVITVAGIDQGLKALDGGLGGFKYRASQKVNIFGNGIRATIGVLDFSGLFNALVPRDKLADTLTLFMALIPSSIRPYWAQAWVTTNAKAVPQIGDMIPTSDFVAGNVTKYTMHDYKVKTGTTLVAEWRYFKIWPGIKIYYLWIGNVDVYTNYAAYETVPQFNNKVPLGFIVGTNSNTLSMADDEAGIRKTVKGAGDFFEVVEYAHYVKCGLIIGLLTGSITYANDACEAKNMMRNFDGALNDIKNSTQNDGLVAVESQYLPRTFTHPTTKAVKTVLQNPVLGNDSRGYVPYNLTHYKMGRTPTVFVKAAAMVDDGRKERIRQGLPR